VFWEPCAQKQKPKNSQQLGKTNRFHAHKKNPFSKDLKTQLLGEQNQHATTSLGIKSTKQTGLVFEIFSTNTFGN